MLNEADPEVIFQILAGASPQVLARARELWKTMPNLQAVRNARVHILTDQYFMSPSQHVGELAEQFAGALAEARQ
jgi:ABC-type Fe3+-hydroxamate transport system substrate-binding protein